MTHTSNPNTRLLLVYKCIFTSSLVSIITTFCGIRFLWFHKIPRAEFKTHDGVIGCQTLTRPALTCARGVLENKIESLYKSFSRSALRETDKSTLEYLHGVLQDLQVLRTRRFSRELRPESCKACFVYDYTNLLPTPTVCGRQGVSVVFLITSVPNNTAQRAAIRATWASASLPNTTSTSRHVFLFGAGWGSREQQILERESSLFGDIVQDDFHDSYYNLSHKVLMGLHWAQQQCPQAGHVVRAADDIFINTRKIMETIEKYRGTLLNATVLGYCLPRTTPQRRVTNKHMVTQAEWPLGRLYPPYCQGTAYLMTSATARQLLATSAGIPYFPLEDVYMGMVMEAGAMRTVDVPGFSADVDYWTLCTAYHIVHPVNATMMGEIWDVCHTAAP